MSGLTGLQSAAAQAAAERQAWGENRIFFAKFSAGTPHRVRFLEQGDDVAWAYVHEAPKPNPQAVAKVTPCLNQDGKPAQACPGCEQGKPRKIKGWINLIFRNAPKLARDADGKILKDPITNNVTQIGVEDQVQTWNSGPQLFTTLAQKDITFKGLMSRDFVVIRTGEKLDTKYAIEPADADGGPQPMSEADLKLAADKPVLKSFTIPEDYEVARQFLLGVPMDAIKASQAAIETAVAPSSNVFEEMMRIAREAEGK